MRHGQPSPAAPPWTLRSVAIRTRDGPERLEDVYRRLLLDPPPEATTTANPHCSATSVMEGAR